LVKCEGGYAERKKGCCGWKNNAECKKCGEIMCFKCGAVSHNGVACGSVGNAEL
jgi:hypothetical protein